MESMRISHGLLSPNHTAFALPLEMGGGLLEDDRNKVFVFGLFRFPPSLWLYSVHGWCPQVWVLLLLLLSPRLPWASLLLCSIARKNISFSTCEKTTIRRQFWEIKKGTQAIRISHGTSTYTGTFYPLFQAAKITCRNQCLPPPSP